MSSREYITPTRYIVRRRVEPQSTPPLVEPQSTSPLVKAMTKAPRLNMISVNEIYGLSDKCDYNCNIHCSGSLCDCNDEAKILKQKLYELNMAKITCQIEDIKSRLHKIENPA